MSVASPRRCERRRRWRRRATLSCCPRPAPASTCSRIRGTVGAGSRTTYMSWVAQQTMSLRWSDAAVAERPRRSDHTILLLTLLLVAIGLGVIYSASGVLADKRFGAPSYFLKRQLLWRSEEHTSELQSRSDLVCRLLLEKKKYNHNTSTCC